MNYIVIFPHSICELSLTKLKFLFLFLYICIKFVHNRTEVVFPRAEVGRIFKCERKEWSMTYHERNKRRHFEYAEWDKLLGSTSENGIKLD